MRPLLLIASLLSASQSFAAGRHALVVGANDGGDDLEPLRHAESDAGRVAEVLQELGGFAPGDVTLLPSPTAEEIRAALGSASTRSQDELFLFYYSGHADARGLRLGGDVLPYEELKAAIRAVPADVHLGVLDACRSGAITRIKGIKGATVAEPFLDQVTTSAEGEAWIAATTENEDAQESDQIGGSFFTHYLVSGLRGAADNGDGRVSLNEAYSYAYDRTVARTAATTAGPQHPAYDFRINGNGDLPLTDVNRASASIVLPEEVAGIITVVRQPDGTPVAEVSKREGSVMRLALPPGTYLVRRRVDGVLREVRVGLSDGSAPVLDRWGFSRPEVATIKGEEIPRPRARSRAGQATPSTADLVREVLDFNADGTPDIVNWYRPRSQAPRLLVRKDQDQNRDGRIDVITWLDPLGHILREEMDRNFDGNFDWIDQYLDGQRVASEYDTMGRGFPDEFAWYLDGRIVRKERDTDGDGQTDVWEEYDGDRMVRSGEDTDGDGVVDRRQ